MNTPSPCNRCKNLAWNCITEEDPGDSAWCKLDEIGTDYSLFSWGDDNCLSFTEDKVQMMGKYIVEKREVWTQMVEVEAESDLEAIKAVSNGHGTEIDNTLEYSHDMPVDSWTTDKVE